MFQTFSILPSFIERRRYNMLWTTKLTRESAYDGSNAAAEALALYAQADAFAQPSSFYTSSPYRRPSRPQDINDSLLTESLKSNQLSSSHHLLAQRLLLNNQAPVSCPPDNL